VALPDNLHRPNDPVGYLYDGSFEQSPALGYHAVTMPNLTESDIVTVADFVSAERYGDAVAYLMGRFNIDQMTAINAVDHALENGAIDIPEPIHG